MSHFGSTAEAGLAQLTAARERMQSNPLMPRAEYSATYELIRRLSRELSEAHFAEHPIPATEFTAENYRDFPDSFEQAAINRLRMYGQMRLPFNLPAGDCTTCDPGPSRCADCGKCRADLGIPVAAVERAA